MIKPFNGFLDLSERLIMKFKVFNLFMVIAEEASLLLLTANLAQKNQPRDCCNLQSTSEMQGTKMLRGFGICFIPRCTLQHQIEKGV